MDKTCCVFKDTKGFAALSTSPEINCCYLLSIVLEQFLWGTATVRVIFIELKRGGRVAQS